MTPEPQVGAPVATEDSALAAAIRRYEERLARDPGSLAFSPLADAYRKAGRARDPVRLCREGPDRFPQYATAPLILAQALVDDGNPDGALGGGRSDLSHRPPRAH